MPASSSSSSTHLSSKRQELRRPSTVALVTGTITMKPQQEHKKVVTNNTSVEVVIRYGECRKNHAASIGGYAVDGCREFMASGEEGTSAALLCAACGCHRSFHKREVEAEDSCDCSSVTTSRR